jgi:hypothetical protein
MGFVDLFYKDFSEIKDDVLQEVNEASEYKEQYEHDRDDPSVNKGIVEKEINGSNMQSSPTNAFAKRHVQVVSILQYFFFLETTGVLIATHYGQIGKERVPSHHTRIKDGLKDFLLLYLSSFTLIFWFSMHSKNLDHHVYECFLPTPFEKDKQKMLTMGSRTCLL